jgi:hypothetical protein
MAKLVDCASLFSVAFAVDAVIPALSFAFRSTHERITRRTADAIQKHVPSIVIKEKDVPLLLKFVKGSSVGLRFADRAKAALIGMFLIGMLASFVGLVVSATNPEVHLADWIVWVFAIYTLLVCPALQIGYDRFIRFLEHVLIVKWEADETLPLTFAGHYASVAEARENVSEPEQKLKEFQSKIAEREWAWKVAKLRKLLRKAKQALQRVFSIKEVKG